MNRLLISARSRPFLNGAARSLRAANNTPAAAPTFSLIRHSSSGGHSDQETFDEFTRRYTQFFDNAEDLFELQRGLNNCFAYDLVPSVEVVQSALKASRRLDTYTTAVRIFEGLREKVENHSQYEAYLQELKPIKDELGILTKEELFVDEEQQ